MSRISQFILSLILLTTGTVSLQAQTTTDSLLNEVYVADSVQIARYKKRFNPQKAILYAAILPGLGQVYTKKYWKLPLVYGGFYGIGYGLNFYQKFYTDYKSYLYYNLENGLSADRDINPQTGFSTAQIRTIIDRARRQRDYMIVFMGLMYVLQMVDAHVDTHLKEFDLNPQLRVSLEPRIDRTPQLGRQNGVALVIFF